jgi:hypothetical protein
MLLYQEIDWSFLLRWRAPRRYSNTAAGGPLRWIQVTAAERLNAASGPLQTTSAASRHARLRVEQRTTDFRDRASFCVSASSFCPKPQIESPLLPPSDASTVSFREFVNSQGGVLNPRASPSQDWPAPVLAGPALVRRNLEAGESNCSSNRVRRRRLPNPVTGAEHKPSAFGGRNASMLPQKRHGE